MKTLYVKEANGNYAVVKPAAALSYVKEHLASRVQRGNPLNRPELVQDYLVTALGGYEHEVFGGLFLDAQLKAIKFVELAHGTLSAAAVYPRMVAKQALLLNAEAVVFAHNHPSGSEIPSREDRMLTERLISALRAVEVRVIDHFVIAGDKAISMAMLGML